MSTSDASAFHKLMAKSTGLGDQWRGARFVPEFDLEAFDKIYMEHIAAITIPVTEDIFAEHVKMMEYEIAKAPSPTWVHYWESQRERNENMLQQPMLPFSYAMEAFAQLTLQDNGAPEMDDYGHVHHHSSRYRALMGRIIRMGEEIWRGEDIDHHVDAFATILNDPYESVNLAMGKLSATKLAQEIVDCAYAAKAQFHNQGRDR